MDKEENVWLIIGAGGCGCCSCKHALLLLNSAYIQLEKADNTIREVYTLRWS